VTNPANPANVPVPVAQAAEETVITVRADPPPITERLMVIEVTCGSTTVYVRPWSEGHNIQHWTIAQGIERSSGFLRRDGDRQPAFHGDGEYLRGAFQWAMATAHGYVYQVELARLAKASLADILRVGKVAVPTGMERTPQEDQ